jgi:polyhydroxyalkanoate synthesis regulator phasin
VTQLDGLRRYIEAATTLTLITRARAEELVRDLVASGELERGRAQDWIEDLVKRSREASETLVSTVTSEVDRQLGDLGLKNLDLDDLAQRVAAIIGRAGIVGRTVTSQRSSDRDGHADGGPTAKKSSPKSQAKSPAGKSSAKKKDSARSSGSKSSTKQSGKGSSSKKTESKKVAGQSEAETSGTAT